MHVTIDRVGQIVIPERFRDALGLGPDTQLEIIPDGAGLRLEPVHVRERSIGVSDGVPILEKVEGVVLTDNDVQRLRDDIQRR